MSAAEMIPAWVDGTLVPVEKMRAHREALRHKAVSVFVMRGRDTLIQRRALSKYHTPGLWANTCCTHPRWDEPPEDCAMRRLREELGIEGLAPVHRDRIEYRADVGGGLTEHEVVEVFVAETVPGMPLAPDPAEVAEAVWIDMADLEGEIARRPERFTPWLRIYLDEHMERIFGPG